MHRWAHYGVWVAALVLALLLLATAVRARGSGAAAPTLVRGPLWWPGLAFLAWVLIQLAPWPRAALCSLSPRDTWRGAAFVGAALVVHAAAATLFVDRSAARRFQRLLCVWAALLALVGLVQLASGAQRIYGVFTPLERGGSFFGPFVNRNHFAAYMVLALPICLGEVSRAWRRVRDALPPAGRARSLLLALGTPAGSALVALGIATAAAVAALLATQSRGALLALLVGMAVGAVGAAGQGRRVVAPAFLFLGLAAAVAVLWLGTERLSARFGRAQSDSHDRLALWEDVAARVVRERLWLCGTGFNTFGYAFGRVVPWELPTGATAWPEALAAGREERVGYYVPARAKRNAWYREAHNEYLQLVAETGVPGLLIALWAAAVAVARARSSPWSMAALTGFLFHCAVEFDLQIPALSLLFAALVALPPAPVPRAAGVRRPA